MRLYSFFRSSAAFRVRIALNLKHVDYEIVSVQLPQGEHHGERFLETNPLAAVPVLEHDGARIHQSLAIIEYLESSIPSRRLLPSDPLQRAHVQAFAQTIACEIHPLNNLRVLRYLRADVGLDEPAVVRWYAHWIAEVVSRARGDRARVRAAGGIASATRCRSPTCASCRRCTTRGALRCDLAPYPTLVRIADGLRETPALFAAAPEQQPDAE